MKINHIYHGNALEVLRSLPGESISCVVSSPPYWGLRDYGPETATVWDEQPGCEHEWGESFIVNNSGGGWNNPETRQNYPTMRLRDPKKENPKQVSQGSFCQKCPAWRGALGLEPTFELYIRHLCSIFDEIKRVLRKDGTCWVNLGDSYAGSGSPGGDFRDGKGGDSYLRPYQHNGMPAKSLCLIPERFAIEMVNRGWIARNKIIWYKRNCMPQSASDRFTVDYEPIFFFTKNPVYYFEQQFEKYTQPLDRWGGDNLKDNGNSKWNNGTGQELYRERNMRPNELGRNKRTVWQITTEPTPEAHFATFPQKLVETPIKAGCPEHICTKCGKPREKIIEKIGTEKVPPIGGIKHTENGNPIYSGNTEQAILQVIGLTDCGCRAPYEPGIVLDPFMGAGTTAIVARKLNRNFIGIEMNKQYINIAKSRMSKELGMFA